MRILLTFNTAYAPHAATVMESIVQNCPERLDFVVIYHDLSDEAQSTLAGHFESKVKSLEFVRINRDILQQHCGESIKFVGKRFRYFDVYSRLFAPSLLPDDYVIYLDCDTIVLDNILKITDGADLSKPVCAVTAYDPNYKLKSVKDLEKLSPITRNDWAMEACLYRTYINLGMNHTAKYFGTGVMIINLNYWRQYKITDKALAFLQRHPDKAGFADQDGLNHVINGNYFALHPRWNYTKWQIRCIFAYPLQEMQEAHRNTAIMHIYSHPKAWDYMCSNGYQKLYWRYRKDTPWNKIEYPDKTLGKAVKKHLRMLYVHLTPLFWNSSFCANMMAVLRKKTLFRDK